MSIDKDWQGLIPESQIYGLKNKLASLEATLVRNSAQRLTHSLTGVKCRATSVAKNLPDFQ